MAHSNSSSRLPIPTHDAAHGAQYSRFSEDTGESSSRGHRGSRSPSAPNSPSPSPSPSPPFSSRTLSPSLRSHRSPPSPQDTFGPYTPMTPGHGSQMPTMPAVPEPATTTTTTITATAIEIEIDLNSSPEPDQESPLPSPPRLKRAGSPDSSNSGHSYGQTTTRSGRSNRSSWQFTSSPTGSTAALAVARKQRVSQAPPLHGHPYMPPPDAQHRPLTPNAATSLLAAATATASAGHMQSPAASATSLSSPRSMTRAGRARERARMADFDKPLPEIAAEGPPKTSTDLAMAIAAGEVPRFAFLDEDPTRAESPASMRGGVSAYSGAGLGMPSAPPNAARHVSAPYGGDPETSSQRKHRSIQSTVSEPFAYGQFQSPYGTSSSMAEAGASDRSSPGSNGSNGRSGPVAIISPSPFAGGPPVAWGRRDSQRSVKSSKSKTSTRSKKRRSKPGAVQEEWEDDDEVDLLALARRAAVLERLLRHGKRVSALPSAQRSYHRYSAWSVSTAAPSRHTSSRFARAASPQAGRVSPPRTSPSAPSSSQSHSQRRSQNSSNSIRRRLQRRFMKATNNDRDREFTGLDSGDEEDIQVRDDSYDEAYSVNSAHTPRTPIRRAFSTSFSRREQTPPPGAGAGVIVFPELATMQPIDPPLRDGEVCAQACLPPSIAVPYTPLPPPPPVALNHKKSYSGVSGTGTGHSSAMVSHGRSLHSLKNMHHPHDEKERRVYQPEQGGVLFGDVPACDEQMGRVMARKWRILIAIVCVCGVILIVGLLAGLLTRRARR